MCILEVFILVQLDISIYVEILKAPGETIALTRDVADRTEDMQAMLYLQLGDINSHRSHAVLSNFEAHQMNMIS